jgi:poly-gamma-glutamate capsule biosynthesis protein CapA/YwtB (metallophosphatase superfamily)
MHFCKVFIICAAVVVLSAYPASAREIVINAVGDIMLAGSGAMTSKRLGYDYPFAATREVLKKGDIAIGNLESPIARSGNAFTGKKFHYRSAPRAAIALKNAGFSLVTLANNHMMDFGPLALEETRRHLERAGIGYTGAGASITAARKRAVITVRGTKVAFLAYSLTFPDDFYAATDRAGTAPGIFSFYRDDIAGARKEADYVVVSFHWGTEGSTITKPYQVAAAHRAIDAGADVVIGHHPHVLQGIEHYKNGVILYSLGNYAFGTASKTAKRSIIARVILGNGVKGVELVPLNVLNREVHFQPRVLSGKEGQEVIDHLNHISRRWNTTITASGGRYLVEMGRGEVLARK